MSGRQGEVEVEGQQAPWTEGSAEQEFQRAIESLHHNRDWMPHLVEKSDSGICP
jgi:hypothetical protein